MESTSQTCVDGNLRPTLKNPFAQINCGRPQVSSAVRRGGRAVWLLSTWAQDWHRSGHSSCLRPAHIARCAFIAKPLCSTQRLPLRSAGSFVSASLSPSSVISQTYPWTLLQLGLLDLNCEEASASNLGIQPRHPTSGSPRLDCNRSGDI